MLPASRGLLLERPVANSIHRDAMGLYPLFCCADWRALESDLSSLRDRLVSVVLVADPFGEYDETLLRRSFDRVSPFKTHFVVDLEQPGRCASPHHRYYAERALREVRIEICDPPSQMLSEWVVLYGQLIQRHGIRGVQAFSPESFRRQFRVPGLVCLRAIDRSGECVGAQLWFVHGQVAYSHLSAASERGYQCACSYALYRQAIEYFQGQVRWLDLGGGAGTSQKQDGLTRFKAGWSNTTKTAFLCGRILDPSRYRELSSPAAEHAEYFPAYRYAEAV
ncbi:MAG: GNAT family N-acetyltransferase [Acidobacteriia bacterium]|nr:GNAT family N-acetyltransferase [Terriglobia bacterium]